MQNGLDFFFPGSWGISIPNAGLACSDGEPGHLESSGYGSCPVCLWCPTGRNLFFCSLAAYCYLYFSTTPALIMICPWQVMLWRLCSKLCGFEKTATKKTPKTCTKQNPLRYPKGISCLSSAGLQGLSSWVGHFDPPNQEHLPKQCCRSWLALEVRERIVLTCLIAEFLWAVSSPCRRCCPWGACGSSPTVTSMRRPIAATSWASALTCRSHHTSWPLVRACCAALSPPVRSC